MYDDFRIEPATCWWSDFDCGCTVDEDDMIVINAHWNCRLTGECLPDQADTNGNGKIDMVDLIALTRHHGMVLSVKDGYPLPFASEGPGHFMRDMTIFD